MRISSLARQLAAVMLAPPLGASVLFLPFVSPALAEGPSVGPIQHPQQVLTTPDYRGDLTERTTLTGDWGGARQGLANSGVTVDANLTQVTPGVVSGGIETGWDYMGRGEVSANIDTAKLGLWPGGLLTVMGEGNYAEQLLTDKTGALLPTNLNGVLPEPDDSFVIPQFTFAQFLSPSFGVVIGKFATIGPKGGDANEFAHGKGSEQFLNLALNVNPAVALTVPYSTLGVSAIALPTKDLMLSASVLDPHGKANSAGFSELFDNGATFAGEGRYTTNFFGRVGHQTVGGTYSTSDYADLDQSAASLIIPRLPTAQAEHSWSAYWNMDHYLYQPDSSSDRGVGFFARYGVTDGQANPIHNFASAGIGSKGIVPNRENDRCGLGYFYVWAADTEITSRLGFEDGQGFEAYYDIALTPALRVAPDIQWVDPSQNRIDSSWVGAVRLYTVF